MEKEKENFTENLLESEQPKLSTKDSLIQKSLYLDNFDNIDLETLEPIEYQDMKTEDSISVVIKSLDFTNTISTILNSIENYSYNNKIYDEYPYFRIQNTCKFIPKLNFPSQILSYKHLREIHVNLPYYHQFKNLQLVFSPNIHGMSMRTFYYNCKNFSSYIIVIEDQNENIFGGFINDKIKCSDNFYGTGESFVFTFYKSERIHCFHATGTNDLYIRTDEDSISIGASSNLYSLFVNGDFNTGYTDYTKTFNNPLLTEDSKFDIYRMEIWSFTDELV